MPNKKKLYEALKAEGYDNFADESSFNAYVDNVDNRKKLFSALKQEGYDNFADETEFEKYLGYNNSEDNSAFEANAERFRNGQPIERVTTQSVIDANPELELGDQPYQYKPEVQEHILKNKPDMFKPKQSLMDAPLGINAPEGSDEKFQARINVAQKNLQDPEYQKGRVKSEFRVLSDSVNADLEKIEDAITSRQKAVRNTDWKPGMPSSRDDAKLSELRGQRTYLEGAKELIEDSQNILNAVEAEKDGSFFGGLGRGIRDKAFDIDTWTMGLSDLVGGLRLKSVLEKAEKGETLTPAEEKLLDASVNNMAVNFFYRNDLGLGYQAGEITGQSIPFMLEFLVNPVSASGNAMAKRLLTYGLKRFGSAVNSKAIKAGTRLATDALASGGVTATTGMGHVLSGGVERLNRNYEYGLDEEGNLNVVNTHNMGVGEAFAKSATSAFLERQSEMIFNAFRGAPSLFKGIETSLPGGVNTFMNYVSNSRLGELWRGIKNNATMNELAKRTQFHGLGEEYLEEVYNNFANIPLGEMTFEEATNLENNIVTFLGLAPTQVMFSAIGGIGYGVERYKAKRDLERTFGKMTEEQKRKLIELQEMGKLSTNKDIAFFLAETIKDESFTPEQKRAEIEYAYNLAKQNAIDEVSNTDVEDSIDSENQQIDAATDPQTGMYGEVNLVGKDLDGNDIVSTANVFGEKEVNGELYLLVLPEGETEKKWVRPNEYDANSYQKRPAEEVKAINEEMIREEAAQQAEQEAKYAPEVINAQMQQGVPFDTPNAQIVPVAPMPEGNGWIVEEYALDTNNKVAKTPIVRELTNDEYRDMLQAQLNAEEAAQEQIAAEGQAAAPEVVEEVQPTEEADVKENFTTKTGNNLSPVEEVAQPQAEVKPQTPVIPTKEDGSIDFVSYGKEGTFKTLGEKYGEKMPNKVAVTAKALAEDLKKAQNKLQKAEEAYDNAPIGREQKAEEARDNAKQELEAIQREANFWAEMDAEIKDAQARRESMLNPQAEVETSTEPMNVDEFVAQQLASGNIVLDKEDYKKETGYGDTEANAMNGGATKLFGKNGMTIQEAGERLMEIDRENGTNFFDQLDSNSGRDALINVLGSVKSRKELNQYIATNRAEQAKRESEGLRNELEKQAMEANYASLEDYVLQMEVEEMENPFLNDRADEIMAIFAEEAAKYEQSLNNTENGQGTENEVVEGNDRILSEEQLDNTGRTEVSEESERIGDGTSEESESAHAATEVELKQEEGETTLQFAERAAEENRRRPLRKRAEEWSNTLGIKVTYLESIDDVDADTRREIEAAHANGKSVPGWVNKKGEVFFFMPDLSDLKDVDDTYIHEVVAHVGLPQLLGKERFGELCDKVWDMMPQSEKDYYYNYPGVNSTDDSTKEGKIERQRRAADEYIAHIAEQQNFTPEEKTIWDNIVKMFREMLDKALNGIISKSKLTDEDISNLIKASYANLKRGIQISDFGDKVEVEGVSFNIKTNKEVVENREKQLKRSVRNGILSKKEADEIREASEAMLEIAEVIAQAEKEDGTAMFPSFSQWNGMEVRLNANGMPAVSVLKSNGDYAMNIDFAKDCIKRDATNRVLNRLAQVAPEVLTSMSAEQLTEINNIIKRHGLSVPCVGCFVEARRYRSADFARSVVNVWNALVDAVGKGGKAIDAAKKEFGNKVSVDNIITHLQDNPSDMVLLSESDIVSPDKYAALMIEHPQVPQLLQGTQGQNNPHLVVPEAIYYGDVLKLEGEKAWDVDAAYAVGGVRIQSFSDFKAKLFFDYCQVLADLASKKLPAHSYTKVPSFAELFGLAGVKINLSLYFEGTGLGSNGEYQYSSESISPEFAYEIQTRDGYTENVGTMAIGVSDAHIWKMMKDPNIRSISPYHKSGINAAVAKKIDASRFVDYSNEQNAVIAKAEKMENETFAEYYARIAERKDGTVPKYGLKTVPKFNLYDDLLNTEDPVQTAMNYVEHCQQNGIVPKFPSFVYNQDGSFNNEYYKLIYDFAVTDKDGIYAPQGAVKWNEDAMPANTAEILTSALEVEEATIARNEEEVDSVVSDILNEVVGEGTRFRVKFTEEEQSIIDNAVEDEDVKKTLTKELDYVKAAYDKFYQIAGGMDPAYKFKDANEWYRSLSGEVESRNVQQRMGMTDEQRRNTLASETEDVAREDQIFLKDGIESGMRFRLSEKGKQIQAEVDKFTSKYNSKPVRIVEAEMDDNELMKTLDYAFELEDVKSFMKESKTAAGYFHNLDKIIIFADKTKVERMEEYLFHENIHAAIHHDNFANLVAYFYEYAKDEAVFEKWSKLAHNKEYKQYNTSEEFLAYVVSNAMVARNLDDVAEYLGDKQKKALNKLFNVIGYDYDIRRRSDEQSVNGRTSEETSGESSLEGNELLNTGEGRGTGNGTGKGKSGKVSAAERKARLNELFNKVADMGLQGVLGNKEYTLLMVDIYKELPEEVRAEIAEDALRLYGGSVAPAVSDYIGPKSKNSIMDKVVTIVREALRKVGFDLDLNANEVRYMAWRSKKPLDRNNMFEVAEDIDMKYRLKVEEYDGTTPDGGGTRFRVANKLQVRDEYESTIKKGGYQAREAVQDAMLSLRKFQELIEKASGKKIRDFENAWMHENRLSSVVQAEIHDMERKFYKPMMDAVKKLMSAANLEQEQVADYLMLKHGIERNREMAVRKALTDDKGKIDRTRLEQWYQDKRNVRNRAATPHLDTWRKQQEELDNIALLYGADMSRDYSGLTSMFGTDDLADSTQKAYDEVEALETAHPVETESLGNAVKAMTQNTLDKSFESGLMDRKVYDELSNDMYDYYIPLRGFEDTTSEEVYAYLDQDRGAFNAPLKRAKGRSSKSDNPIAYLKSIAESGIMQGNRNKMKQSFLNMVINNPSDLVSVREGVWVIYNPASGEWEAASAPAIPNNATPADVEAAMEAWEQQMEQAAQNDPNIKKVSEAADVPYRVVGNRMDQHQVIVKRLGKSYTLTINGNPRLAMAINGQTNPNNTSNDGKVAAFVNNKIGALNRSLAAWYTTRNPDFVASNFMRDTFYTNTIVRAKEGNAYANKFHKNYATVLPKMLGLFRKYENGTLNPADQTEAAFIDFMMNGGETGYSNLKDVEEIKKQISKELKGNRFGKVEALAEKLDILNRAVENTARFAAFLTSREEGRSIAKSVFDAKEISVNFNKKGAGGTFFGMTGQTWFGNLASMVGASGRALYVFFNAAIQGTTNLMHVMKVNPKGTSAGLAAMFLMGAVIPFLFDDDDEKDYYDLPEHVRRNHLIIPGTNDAWISIPLPIEYRIMYGMGELLTSWRTGHERGSDIGRKMINLTGQALPLNFLEEGFDAFIPSALSPVWQVYNNRSWTGLPIYKDNEFNKDDPEYTKAYKNVDRGIYEFTKALYNWTFDEENQKERIDLNPAVIEALARGYFGGLATQLSNIGKTAEIVAGEREFDWRSIPIGNRLFKSGDERTKEKRVTNEYFENMEKLDFLQSRERMLKKTEKGVAVPEADKFKAQKDLETMQGTEVYKKYQEFKKQKKVVDKIRKTIKEKGSTPEREKQLMEAQEKANKSVR